MKFFDTKIFVMLVILWMLSAGSLFAQQKDSADTKDKSKTNQPSPAGSGEKSSSVKSLERPKPLNLPPQPIEPGIPLEPFENRLARKINLDVRDMNVMDVIRFLAKNGEFNVVTSSAIDGRATLQLKGVSIKDALDITVISNRLAYHIQNDIIQVMTAAEYALMYGKEFSDKTEVRIVHLHYAKPSYVLATLNNLKSAIGKIIIDEDTGSVVMIDTVQTI